MSWHNYRQTSDVLEHKTSIIWVYSDRFEAKSKYEIPQWCKDPRQNSYVDYCILFTNFKAPSGKEKSPISRNKPLFLCVYLCFWRPALQCLRLLLQCAVRMFFDAFWDTLGRRLKDYCNVTVTVVGAGVAAMCLLGSLSLSLSLASSPSLFSQLRVLLAVGKKNESTHDKLRKKEGEKSYGEQIFLWRRKGTFVWTLHKNSTQRTCGLDVIPKNNISHGSRFFGCKCKDSFRA